MAATTVPPRRETGVVSFGDDWPGVFIRGDEALALAAAIRGAETLPTNEGSLLGGLAKTLEACRRG